MEKIKHPHYEKKIIIAKCNKKGDILGGIERWEAHKKGILHRAFTVAIVYKNKFLIQHRKHPVFDGALDITSSSHQLYENGKLQDTIEATFMTLKREWNIEKKDLLKQPKDLGTIYYKAKDKFSIYTEHEVCNIVVCEVKKLPSPNLDFAYGYSMASKKELSNTSSRIFAQIVPWVQTMIKENKL